MFYWVALWQSGHHSSPNNPGTRCCVTFHHVPLKTTAWLQMGNILLHSIAFRYVKEGPIASKPFKKSLLHQFTWRSTRFLKVLLYSNHSTVFRCTPLLQTVHRSVKNSQESCIASHYTLLHSISQISTLFRSIPPHSRMSGSIKQSCIRFQFTPEPFIASHYNRFHNIALHPTTHHHILSRSILQKKAPVFYKE